MKGYHLIEFRSVILLSLKKNFKKKEENCSDEFIIFEFYI